MKLFKIISLMLVILSQLSCGTLLHPERQGQTSGRLDPAIVALDSVGVLLYLIPGLVAFAIDFHQGTIYLPNTAADTTGVDLDARTVKINGPVTKEKIEATLEQELGVVIDLDNPSIQVSHLDSVNDQKLVLSYLAE